VNLPATLFGPLVPGHGDPNWENVLFAQDHVAAVLDFQNVTVAPRIFDVGAAALVFSGPDPVARQRFMAAYTEATGWTPPPAVLRVAMLQKALQSITFQASMMHTYNTEHRALAQAWVRYLQQTLSTV
jgi:aminoglycoside phosphotransferase (APT) family kinase protein